MKKEAIIITSLISITLILLAIVGYFVYDRLQRDRQTELESIAQQGLQQGFQQGYQQAVKQIITQASSCSPIPIWFDNQTVNMIDVDCLRQVQSPQQIQAAQQAPSQPSTIQGAVLG
jgi:hypothetical protein